VPRADSSGRALLLATSAALALAALSCGRADPERLTVGVPRLTSMGLFFAAAHEGTFRAHGVEVEERAFTLGRDALRALLRGEVDVALVYATPVVLAAPHAPQLEVLSTLHLSDRDTRVVARADRGVRTAADLRGKRVAVPRGTSAELFLETLLAFEGVPVESVALVDLLPADAAGALARGEVDAVASFSPFARIAARALGPGGAVEITSEVYTEASMVVTRADVRRTRSAALVRFLRGLADAAAIASERPERVAAALERTFGDEDAGATREQWARITPELGISNLLATVLRREDEWLRRTGAVEGPPLDLARLLQPGPLEAVAYDLVTFTPLREGPP
jgi:NitT/TauT family transport system substrate-binding protein